MADYYHQIQIISWIGVGTVFALAGVCIFIACNAAGHIVQKLERNS